MFLLKTDPGTQKFNIEQAIPPYDLDVGGNFGSAIAISDDGQWLAVGQPDFGEGFVYIYQLNEAVIPPTGTQTLTYDGSSLTFTLDGSAADPQSIDALTVTANGITLDPGTDYTLSGSDITFIASPVAEGGKIYVEVARAEPEQKFTGDGSTDVFTLTGDNATPSSVYALKIVVDGILQIPFRDYDLSTNVITFTTAPIDNAGITVYQKSYFEYVDAFTAGVTSSPLSTVVRASATTLGFDTTTTAMIPGTSIQITGASITGTMSIGGVAIAAGQIYYVGAPTTAVSATLYATYANALAATSPLTIIAGTGVGGATFTEVDASVGDKFGASLSWTTDGRSLVVGCPNDNNSSKTNPGAVYIYDRTAVEFVGDGATTTFSASVQTQLLVQLF